MPQKKRSVHNKKKKGRRGGRTTALVIRDSSALKGIKQGVGATVTVPFGTRKTKRKRGRGGGKQMSHLHFNAFHPAHVSLPRPVGPYSVVRTTQVVSTTGKFMVFGPSQVAFNPNPVGRTWTNGCGYIINNVNDPINAPDNVTGLKFESMSQSSWRGCQITPAAFSVQMMCGKPLQTAEGIIYIGRYRTMLDLSNNPETGTALQNQFVSYNMPRLCSAAKLAFRGVHTDLVPFNMAAISNFTVMSDFTAGEQTIGGVNIHPVFEGFAPMCVANPNGLDLTFLVCCEWRVRFDPSNPAQGTHQRHAVSTDSYWEKAQAVMETMGHGVRDIADVVAETGTAVNAARRAIQGPASVVPMLVD